jgi:hypothetical protein
MGVTVDDARAIAAALPRSYEALVRRRCNTVTSTFAGRGERARRDSNPNLLIRDEMLASGTAHAAVAPCAAAVRRFGRSPCLGIA